VRVRFAVAGLAPKKDGANSIWRKGAQRARLKALRLAASEAMAGRKPFASHAVLRITVHCNRQAGDLDSLAAGICDGLMPAHPLTPIDVSSWSDLPAEARPSEPIAFHDDAVVDRIEAVRRSMAGTAPQYDVEITGE